VLSSKRGRGAADEHPVRLEDLLPGLLEAGLLDRRQAEQALFLAKQRGAEQPHPLVLLAEQGWQSPGEPPERLDIERLTRWLAERCGLPYLRIDPLKVDVEAVTGVVKQSYATRFNILPVAVSGDQVTVATGEPFVREWERELTRILHLRIERVLANPLAVERYRREFYAVSRSIDGARARRAGAPVSPSANLEQLVELGAAGEVDANDQHIVRVVDWLLQYAFEQRASDIHLEPRRERGNVRFRIDGVLHTVHQIPSPVLAAAISRLKALGRMDVVERRRPQDGRIKTKSGHGREVELRLSTMPTTFGEKLVARIFDPEVLVKSFPALGFSPADEALWRRFVAQPYGLIAVTGPTGSGKTTTLYSALKQLARPELNICTIEDPIELVEPAFNQMYVQTNIGLDFASGVRTLLRQDPDIIMVGEVRDAETASTAVQAALTGHLVLTTLHTNDAPATITRLLELGVEPYLIRSALLGVVAQRLVRTLCPHCKEPARLDPDTWRSLVAPFEREPPEQVCAARGCDECRRTGYRGRIGIFEILAMSDGLRALVRPGTETGGLRAQALAEGMRPLRLSGAEKVAAGLTTPSEVFEVVQEAG